MKNFITFIQDETGTTAIEYSIIATLISLAAITSMATIGSILSNTFSNVTVDMTAR